MFFLALFAFSILAIDKLRIEKIVVVGDLFPSQREQLESNLVRFQNKNFLFVNFFEMEKSLEALSWLDTVRVKRVWPRKIKLQIDSENISVVKKESLGEENNGNKYYK